MKVLNRFAGAALAAVLVTTATAASADVLILRAVGPSAQRYKAGQRLPDNGRLTLRVGDSVSVLVRGGTRVYRGPGTFALNAPPPRTSIVARGGRVDVGAVRGGPGSPEAAARPEGIWQVDATSTGTACFLTGSQVVLWRPDSRRRLRLVVTPPARPSTIVTWPAGRNTVVLPPAAAADGTRVEYRVPRAAANTRLTLSELKVDARDREALGTSLLERGCLQQLDTFIALNQESAD